MKVGILAIQGDFSLQRNAISQLNVDTKYVRTSEDLVTCDALIIPGGESTTISLLIKTFFFLRIFFSLTKLVIMMKNVI